MPAMLQHSDAREPKTILEQRGSAAILYQRTENSVSTTRPDGYVDID